MNDDHFIDPLLHLLLLVTGVIFLAASLCMLFTPLPLAGWFMRAIAHGRFPDLWASSSLLAYMLRTTGILYAWLGASFLLAANDPGRYRSWARLSGIMLLVMAATCAISGLIYHLPRVIYLGDGALAAIGGFFLVRFGRIRRPAPDQGAAPGSGT
ncbi:MAG TPA: hypothetical protein VM658_11000 [bacterium]|nr:hypothetical protein [bacterium]